MVINNLSKLSLSAVGAALMAFATGGVTQAATFQPASWVDNLDGIDQYLSTGESYSYTHDITDNGFDGFPHDIILSYTLGVQLADDSNSKLDLFEFAEIDLPGLVGDRVYEVNSGLYEGGLSLLALLQLNATGTLDVTIKSVGGDFKVLGSHLTAYGKEKVKDVPEPASLLGLVMVGALSAGTVVKRKHPEQAV